MFKKVVTTTAIVGALTVFGGLGSDLKAEASSKAKVKIDTNSIVDFLVHNEENHSFEAREHIAKDFDIKDYKGTEKQNIKLLKKLKKDTDYEFTYKPEPKSESKEDGSNLEQYKEREEEQKPQQPKVQTGYTEEVTAGQEEDNTKNETQEPKQEQEVEKETTNPTEESGQVMTMEATYYSAYCSTGCTGVTAMGDDVSNTNTVNGKRVIAVDPNVIPLGTTVQVSGGGQNFTAIARDTGGSIKGNRIDILVGSTEEAYSLGRSKVEVTILD